MKRLVAATLAAFLLPHAALAQAVLPGDMFTSLTAASLTAPNPVMGADGKIHLAYEVVVTNPGRLHMSLDRIEAVDAAGTSLLSLEGDALKTMTVAWNLADGMIPPGGMAILLLDVPFAADAKLPETVATRVTATRRLAGKDGKLALLPPDASVPSTITFTAAETGIGPSAIAIDPPLKGDGWVAINGCCDAPVSHRVGMQIINGVLKAPERFAIDWMQLDKDGKLFVGDGGEVEDYSFYGAPVYAVADAAVIEAFDGLDPQVPLKRDPNIKPDFIDGNMIVLDLGGGRYALYAHLLQGSLAVKVGDKVKSGQQIARLGNTGNSDGPHLHFHLMDSRSSLNANGLPYVIRGFSSSGVLAGGADAAFEASMAGKKVTIDPRLSGRHENQMPLNDQVVRFD